MTTKLLRSNDEVTPPTIIKKKEVEVDKEEEYKEKTAHGISFEEFWEIAPERNGKKIGKAEAEKKFMKLKADDLANVIVATHNYADSEMVKQGIGIKDPHRFLSNRDNKEYWKEWMEPEIKSSRPRGFQTQVERNAQAKDEVLREFANGGEKDITPNEEGRLCLDQN